MEDIERTEFPPRRRFLQTLAVMAGVAGMLEASTRAGAAASREAGRTSSRTAPGSGIIVVTTPLGQIGRQLLEKLIQEGSSRIRVIERNPSRLPAHVVERVEVVQGSHSEPSVVNEAFKGRRYRVLGVPSRSPVRECREGLPRLHPTGV